MKLLETIINLLNINKEMKMNNITAREREVLYLISYQYSSKEIANKLFVSYETIITHRKNIMRKLQVKNVAGLVRTGFETGLLRAGVLALLLLCLPQLNMVYGQSPFEIQIDDPDIDDSQVIINNGNTSGGAGIFYTQSGDKKGYVGFAGTNNVRPDVFQMATFDRDISIFSIVNNGINDIMHLKKDGNVGIGAVTPTAKLHIEKEGTAGSRAVMLALVASTSKRPTIQFSENPGQTDINGGMSIEYNGAGQGSGNFININSVGGASAMAIFNGGNVNVKGFSKLGSSPPSGTTAPAIKIVELNGTVDFMTDDEFTIPLPAGIIGAKVLDIKATIFDAVNTNGAYIGPNIEIPDIRYAVVWTDTDTILAALDSPTASNLNNASYSLTIMYKQ